VKTEFKSISANDPLYPRFMGVLFDDLVPPEVWYCGNLDLLDRKSVGFCGSRKASEAGLEVTRDCVSYLNECQVVVTSGYASGVDMTAHKEALKQGGETIIVLPEGSDGFRIKKDIRDVWDWSRVLVLSYFQPNAIWRADRAMDRNRAIVSISTAVVVIEAGETGGTLNAGRVALRDKKPLFVATFADMSGDRGGNRLLLEHGARPLMRSKSTGRTQIGPLFNELGCQT
jgi:DNA processing protein